jgi:hypothetical protein
MEAVMGGWVAGYVMAMATTVLLTYLAWHSRDSDFMERLVAREVNSALLTVPIFTFAALGWTMFGVVAGSAYRLAGLDEGGWPGSGFYTLVGFGAVAPLVPLLLLLPRLWWVWLGMCALFAVSFGVLMPALAGQ